MLISVIIPVYNSEKYLNKCLESLEKQTIFNKLELIFIDDGSADNSANILDEFAQRNKNAIVKHVENNGVSNARNIGIKLASCIYISFIDSDDYIDQDYFEMFLNEIEKKDSDIIISGFIAEYSNKSVQKKSDVRKKIDDNQSIIKEFLLGRIEPNSTNKLFKKELIGNLEFETDLAIAEDKFFVFNYLQKINSAIVVDEAKYHYVMNETSAFKKKFDKKRFDSLKVAKKITNCINEKYPKFKELAESMEIDVKCRVYCDIYASNLQNEFKSEVKDLKKDIRSFKISKKIKYSSKKHTLALIAAKISPKLYNILKNEMKLQYKS